LYDYYPSFAAAVVFAILFGMLTLAHIAQAAVFKKVGYIQIYLSYPSTWITSMDLW
jgi:hypothetical protein